MTKQHKPHPSGKQATYTRAPNGLTRTVYRCPCHGDEFQTRTILSMHVRAYRNRIRKDFANMVREGNLGQPAWERLPGETALAYARFCVYLRMEKRTLTNAAKIAGLKIRTVESLSSQWSWRIRADLWDRKVEADAIAEFESDKRRSARRQANLGRKLQDVAIAGASALLINADRLDEMSGNEIAKLADIGTKIERLANSDPTSITDDRGQVRLVWEGPKPSWAPQSPEPRVIEGEVGGPLTQKVLEAGDGRS